MELASEIKESKTPEKQQEWFSELLKINIADIVIACFTVVIGIWTICLTNATRNLAAISEKQEESTRIIERAYVKISHCPPGLVGTCNINGHYVAHLNIKNFGETPATITSFFVTFKMLPHETTLPDNPEYGTETGEPIKVFLVRNDEFFTYRKVTLSSGDFQRIETKVIDLYIYGYVNYVDQFGIRHQSGYARFYDPGQNIRQSGVTDEEFANRSNLNFVTNPNYNYDRERKPGDGNDWNEPQA